MTESSTGSKMRVIGFIKLFIEAYAENNEISLTYTPGNKILYVFLSLQISPFN
jgi:hypothetical protein